MEMDPTLAPDSWSAVPWPTASSAKLTTPPAPAATPALAGTLKHPLINASTQRANLPWLMVVGQTSLQNLSSYAPQPTATNALSTI